MSAAAASASKPSKKRTSGASVGSPTEGGDAVDASATQERAPKRQKDGDFVPPQPNVHTFAESASILSEKNGAGARRPTKMAAPGGRRGRRMMGGGLGSRKRSAKKLVIKPFKVKPTLPDNYEDDTWATLRAAVVAIHTSQPISTSLEELYKMCDNLCAHKLSARLYERLEAETTAHVQGELGRLVGQTGGYREFLPLVHAVWEDHCRHMVLIRQIFLVLDRSYVMQSAQVRSLWDMGVVLFRRHVVTSAEVSRKLVDGLLASIQDERNQEVVDHSLLLSLVRMLETLGLYSEIFEVPFLEATRAYYAAEGQRLVNSYDVPEYLVHVDRRLGEEGDRVLEYLQAETKRPLIRAVEDNLLRAYTDRLLTAGFDDLMDHDRVGDLARVFRLYARVGAKGLVRTAFGDHIKKRGVDLVAEESDSDSSMVANLLEFKQRMDAVLEGAFGGDNDDFKYTVKESFENFINTRRNKPAELIAKFVDRKLRASGHRGSTEEELEATLDAVMVLFRYIQGKDIFEAFYKKDLAKRLLLQKSASFDAEKSMLSKLKSECGSSFTNKLEGMFKDIDLSRDIMASFAETKAGKAQVDIDLSVNVLTMGFWPSYTTMEVNLPVKLAEYQAVFEEFYLSKHNGRRLTWQNSLGVCIVKGRFNKGTKELSVSLFQALVLLCFNDGDELTYETIKEATQIEERELMRTLQSLACGKTKTRVIKKRPKGKEVAATDLFRFNADFSNPLFRIKINQIQMKETKKEKEKTNERVFQDRQYQIDAAIVRIMKARKTLGHAQLAAEVFAQVKFPIQSVDLKKRIESLLDREYMKRDPENNAAYIYVA